MPKNQKTLSEINFKQKKSLLNREVEQVEVSHCNFYLIFENMLSYIYLLEQIHMF